MNVEYLSKIKEIDFKDSKNFYIVDKTCYELNKEKVGVIPENQIFILSAKEKNKSLSIYKKIVAKLISIGFTKKGYIVGVGGGIVCDVTTMVAATYKRGVEHILIPTTLLAMIDASIGGKGALNYKRYKNQIGVIKQPIKNIVCLEFLETLPQYEKESAYGEIIKYAFLSKAIYQYVTTNLEINIELIKKCVECKMKYVNEDLYENNVRRFLNLGHTIGHAVEGYTKNKVCHGMAVAYGIQFVLNRKRILGELSDEMYEEYVNIFKQFNIPKYEIDYTKIKKYLMQDKKVIEDRKIEFVDIIEIGKCEIRNINIDDLLCIR